MGRKRQRRYTLAGGTKKATGPRLYYACKRNTATYTEPCPGIGEGLKGRGKRRALTTGAIEAGVLLWGLRLLDDPERLTEYVPRRTARLMFSCGMLWALAV